MGELDAVPCSSRRVQALHFDSGALMDDRFGKLASSLINFNYNKGLNGTVVANAILVYHLVENMSVWINVLRIQNILK